MSDPLEEAVQELGARFLEPGGVRFVVRFLQECRVSRVYAVVEKSYDAGVPTPASFLKAELRGLGKRRSVFVRGGDPVLQQLLLRDLPPEAARLAAAELQPLMQKRLDELGERVEAMARELLQDAAATARVAEKIEAVRQEARLAMRASLLRTMSELLKEGWTGEDVMAVWKEAQCDEVHSS